MKNLTFCLKPEDLIKEASKDTKTLHYGQQQIYYSGKRGPLRNPSGLVLVLALRWNAVNGQCGLAAALNLPLCFCVFCLILRIQPMKFCKWRSIQLRIIAHCNIFKWV